MCSDRKHAAATALASTAHWRGGCARGAEQAAGEWQGSGATAGLRVIIFLFVLLYMTTIRFDTISYIYIYIYFNYWSIINQLLVNYG